MRVYSFEILAEKDLLTNIVTGGGKTTVIGAMIAYLMIVHDQTKFLILTPNTIVRGRLVDEFDPGSESYTYNVFPFFFNSFEALKNRVSLHIMQPAASPAGVRSGSLILGNIHQIYERTANWKVLMENVESLCIFNDEAHNTKAEQYNDLINKLKPKRFFRLDTTATPDRLDGLHPDSKMIHVYTIAEAMRDKIIKRIVVFHPDVRKVKLTYEDLETGKTISAEEVPWEEIERRKVPARRYITSTHPMRQQIAIALELLKEQRMRTPPPYKPLLFVVAISIADAERIKTEIERVGESYGIRKVLLVTNESEDEMKEAARDLNKNPQTEWDAVVSVLMLREGWDVRNISVILLFRKFSYKEIDGQIFSVYGPQVIGRGLRRMSQNAEQWESLFVVDHPITAIRCQWNTNSDWRSFVPDPKWEKLLNWRLYSDLSGGLMAEFGSHQVDVADWFLGAHPIAVSGVGQIMFYKDGRDVWDHINALIEYPNGVTMNYTSVLTNGYDGVGEQFMGPYGTISLSLGYPLGTGQLAFEIGKKQPVWVKLAHRDEVEGRTVVTLITGKKYIAGAEKDAQEKIGAEGEKNDIVYEFEGFFKSLREGTPPVADVVVGYRDTVTVCKINEAIAKQTRVVLDPALYDV